MIKIIYQRLDKQGLELIRFSGTKQLEQCSVVEIAHLFRMAFIKMSAITQIRRPWLVHPANGQINVLSFGCISINDYENIAGRLNRCAMGYCALWHQ